MNLFNVYPLFEIEPVEAKGCYVWDSDGTKYLDLYGGHAVISIGHSHPHYVKRIKDQLDNIGFYSNSVHNSLQKELAQKLGEISGYPDYQLFLINSGAEAIENALKIAAFHNQRKKIVVFEGAFHGRTSAAVAITHNPKIQSSLNPSDHVTFIPFNDIERLEHELSKKDVCAVVAEGIQGVGGIHITHEIFWQKAQELCRRYDTVLIADEIQSGYGRTGKFFAHQYADVEPDLITVAKGMGNGFPMGAVLIHPKFSSWYGMLGTTFGGNHLACAAGLAVLEVIEQENLIDHSAQMGIYLLSKLSQIQDIIQIRNRGLMTGIQLSMLVKPIRESLLFHHHIFTGSASDPHVLRLLPPLSITHSDIDLFVEALQTVLEKESV